MLESDELHLDTLDPLLANVIRENQEKVVGWMQGQPGCWGFLAGKAVTASRQQIGRSLEDQERRMVWHRLWWWLEQIKGQVLERD
ncbi:MAG: hypothetical protein IH962_00985 [Chloroflexi bacterium]|nr:hypothetical protein [Chloroflexota bacterium]